MHNQKHTEAAKEKMRQAAKRNGAIPPSRKGFRMTEDQKQKLSAAHKGRKPYKMTDEIRRHMSIAKKGKPSSRRNWRNRKWQGAGNPNWKGGITPLTQQIRWCFKSRQWKSDIFMRDNFTCQDCGRKKEASGHLEVHHIKKFSIIIKEYDIKTLDQALVCEELWNINNGITLCEKCHNKTKV